MLSVERFAAALNRRGLFYGWVIVWICFLVLCVNFAVRLSFGIFFEAFTRGNEFNWTRADTAGVFSLSVLVQAFTSGLVGWMLDRLGARAVYVIGLLVLGSGLIVTSRMQSLVDFFLAFGIWTGLGTAILGLTIHGATISRWFGRDGGRGLAIGMAYAGTGMGILVLAPLLERVIATIGWREAYLMLAGCALLLALPMVLLLLCTSPRDLGLHPRDGADSAGVGANRKSDIIWTFGAAMHSPAFWLLMLAGFASLYTLRMITVHQVAHFVDQGVPRLTAAAIFGGAGLITAASYISFGFLSDRIGRAQAFYFGALAQAIALVMLLFLPLNAPSWYLYTYALLWGIGEGSRSGLLTAIVSDRFGGAQIGAIVGTLGGFFGFGAAVGSWAGGLIYDGLGGYALAFSSAIVATGLACACVAIVERRP
ncbi:MAG: MFS transporter [Oscillochloris sp.]|nr:MFS transporter [Oscillochloris sp.]